MIDGIYNVDFEQALELIDAETSFSATDPTIIAACKVSTTKFAAIHFGKLMCLCGFIPFTFMSDTAHLWMITTDVTNDDKLRFARGARDMIQNMLNTYPIITGYVTDERSQRWIRLLGGNLEPICNDICSFTFRRA